MAEFSLLLLSSAVGEDQSYSDLFLDLREDVVDDLISTESPSHENAQREMNCQDQVEEPDWNEESQILDQVSADSFHENILHQNRSREHPSDEIEDDSSERNAYGLLLYPKKGTDHFVRIGRFRCAAQDGGLHTFDDYEFRRVEIV